MTAILSMLVLSMLALGLTAWLLPGIEVTNLVYALLAGVVISLINTFLKPLAKVIGASFNPVALVIFALILNVLLFCLAAVFDFGIGIELAPAVVIALIYSVVMTLLSMVMYKK